MSEQYVMTQKNLDDLKSELDYLVKVKRPEIIERIAEARSHGDLSENAEYDAAREEQRSNEGKIAEIEYQIKNAVVQEEITDNSYVHLNSVVTVLDEEFDEQETYTISSVTDVDVMNNKISSESPVGVMNNKISSESPVGAALMRHKKGDEVLVVSPNGEYKLKIVEIR